MPQPIVVGFDPARQDRAPLHLAAGLARATGAPILAVACYLHDPITNAVSGGAVERDLRDHAADRLREAADDTMETLAVGGSSAARALHGVALERAAGMIVIGATHRGPIGRMSPGSTAEQLLHGAPCPVAVATAGLTADWWPRSIGVGFVDSREGRDALRTGAALAAGFGCGLRAVTACAPTLPTAVSTAWPSSAEYDSAPAQHAAAHVLATECARLPEGVRADGIAIVDDPVAALVELSREVDLVVCGSRGYGPIRSVLLGAHTHAFVRRAHSPIVIVPRGAEQGLAERPAHEGAATA
jgi:nucleotide-binding universal stress UspA family protein